MSEARHGGHLLALSLAEKKIGVVFTVCGSQLQAMFDGCQQCGIELWDTRHQQTAGFAADAWARLTGSVGVVLGSAGPGMSNLVTAAANAQACASPWLCIASGSPLALRHKGSLHEIPSVELMGSVTKWSARIPDVGRIPEYVDIAYRHATSGIPGPVYLEVPVDVALASVPPYVDSGGGANRLHSAAASPDCIDLVWQWLESAERPCLILGSQVAFSQHRDRASDALQKLNLPTCLNGLARGLLPPGQPPLVQHARARALRESDLVLVVGTPFDFRLGYGRPPRWNPKAKVVQADVDPSTLGKNRPVDLGVVADAGMFLSQLAERSKPSDSAPWLEELQAAERNHAEQVSKDLQEPKSPIASLAKVLQAHLFPTDTVCAETGAFVTELGRWLSLQQGQTWLDAGPFGAPGTGPGFALAASRATEAARTIWLTGDGALGFAANEIEMLVRHRVHMLAVVGCNAGYGLFQAGLSKNFEGSTTNGSQLSRMDYSKVFAAYGGSGHKPESAEELEAALVAAREPGVHCIQIELE